jgi:hypothetical protein
VTALSLGCGNGELYRYVRLEVLDGVRFHPEFAETGAYLHIVNRTLYFAVGYEVVAMSFSGSFNSRCH